MRSIGPAVMKSRSTALRPPAQKYPPSVVPSERVLWAGRWKEKLLLIATLAPMREPRFPAATPAYRPFPALRLQAARARRPFPALRHCCPSRSVTQSLRTTAPSCPAARSLLTAQFCHCRPSALPPNSGIPPRRPTPFRCSIPAHSHCLLPHTQNSRLPGPIVQFSGPQRWFFRLLGPILPISGLQG